VLGYIFVTKAHIDNRENVLNSNISSTCLHNVVNVGPLTVEIGSGVWDTRANFNGFRVLAWLLVIAPTSLNGGQPNFARCLAISCAGTLYPVYTFLGALAPNRIVSGAKFTLHPSLAFSFIGSVNARHSSSGCQPNFVAWYKEWNYGTFASGHFQQKAPPIF